MPAHTLEPFVWPEKRQKNISRPSSNMETGCRTAVLSVILSIVVFVRVCRNTLAEVRPALYLQGLEDVPVFMTTF